MTTLTKKIRPVSVTGKIVCADGQEVEFVLHGDGGWQQWGNVEEVLFRTNGLTEALAQAAVEFLPSDYEDEDEE